MTIATPISHGITLLTEDGTPTAIDFSGDSVDAEGNVSDDTASFAFVEAQKRTGHSARARGWQGPFPGEGVGGTDRVRALLAVR